jgi:hypothetical protein
MKRKQICGALNRQGLPCQAKMLLRGRRCRNHGGLSSGALTAETRAKAIDAMHGARHSAAGRMRQLWANPSFKLRIAKAKAASAARRDGVYVAAARYDLVELDRRAAWAAKRRAKHLARIRVLEAEVMLERIATDLGIIKPR